MAVPTDVFGGNSDGYARLEAWVASYCPGCRHGAGSRRVGAAGGSCDLILRAGANQGCDDIPEWSLDAPGADPIVCMKRQPWPRKTRQTAAPAGQGSLL